MSTVQRISLFEFLRSPRAGLPRLNGWQRIWLVLTGVILGLHLLIGFAILPDLSKIHFDPAPHQRRIAEADKWDQEHQQGCKAAAEQVQFAARLNAEYNAKGEARAQEVRAATQARIDEAKTRLFAIETSGGKYYQEWVKYDHAIEAHTQKLREQRWTPRPFDEQAILNPETRRTLQLCNAMSGKRIESLADMDTARQDSERARADAGSVVLGTFFSFLSFAIGLYFAGWCVGWISGGFRRAGR